MGSYDLLTPIFQGELMIYSVSVKQLLRILVKSTSSTPQQDTKSASLVHYPWDVIYFIPDESESQKTWIKFKPVGFSQPLTTDFVMNPNEITGY